MKRKSSAKKKNMKRQKREDDPPDLWSWRKRLALGDHVHGGGGGGDLNAKAISMAMATEEMKRREKWVKHYSSSHQILLVGEGDFSFSLSLALGFGSASNICATSLNSYETLIKKYGGAKSNLEQLRAMEATLLHGVDATKMKHDIRFLVNNTKFDRIVFNFPHAGFYGKEDNPHMIQMHQDLLRGFFSNARWMLHHYGEIHVSHKNSVPYCDWNLNELAQENCLRLLERVPFNIEDYPHYQNKRGHGSSIDEPFKLGDCSTFKFFALPNSSTKMFNLQNPSTKMFNLQNPSTNMFNLQNPSTKMFNLQNPSLTKMFNLQNPSTNMFNLQNPSTKMFTLQNPSTKMFSLQNPSTKMFNLQNPSTKMFNLQNPSTNMFNLQNPSTNMFNLPTSFTNMFNYYTNQIVSRDNLSYENTQNQFNRGSFIPQFKFIVKGLVRQYPIPGAAGYAGALINSENSAMAFIYGPLLPFDSNFAELLAIRHALLMFERSKLCGRAPIVIESDSRVAVSWIKSDIGNTREVQLVVTEITTAMNRIRNADIRCSFLDNGVEPLHLMVNELAMIGSHIKSAVELWH